MISVIPHGNGFRWIMVDAYGRTLVYDDETHPCTHSAFASAKRYRSAFWRIADAIDHRMARCI